MSWGFFCDVEVTLPTKDFARVWKSKSNDHALPTPILGFRSAELESMFTVSTGSTPSPDVPLKNLVKWFKSYSGRSTSTERDGETTFRGCMCIDRGGDPWIARVVAALLYAARPTGRGHLVLVNDGTYSGEDGVLLTLAGGAVTQATVADCRPLGRALGAALFEGAELPAAREVASMATGAAKKRGAAAKKTPGKA